MEGPAGGNVLALRDDISFRASGSAGIAGNLVVVMQNIDLKPQQLSTQLFGRRGWNTLFRSYAHVAAYLPMRTSTAIRRPMKVSRDPRAPVLQSTTPFLESQSEAQFENTRVVGSQNLSKIRRIKARLNGIELSMIESIKRISTEL